MTGDITNQISSWLKNNPLVFQSRFDGNNLTLKEFYSGKSLTLNTKNITKYRLTEHPQGFGEYLNLVIDDQHEVVLCHAGLAFSPCFLNTGPIPDAPTVTCLYDYNQWLDNLKSLLDGGGRQQECLMIFNMLIAILDGAKLIGIDVALEEENLDQLLTNFEKGIIARDNES